MKEPKLEWVTTGSGGRALAAFVTEMTLVAGTLYAVEVADGSALSEKKALTEDTPVEPVSFSDSYRCYLLPDATLLYVVPKDEQEAMDAYWAARGGASHGLGDAAK